MAKRCTDSDDGPPQARRAVVQFSNKVKAQFGSELEMKAPGTSDGE